MLQLHENRIFGNAVERSDTIVQLWQEVNRHSRLFIVDVLQLHPTVAVVAEQLLEIYYQKKSRITPLQYPFYIITSRTNW